MKKLFSVLISAAMMVTASVPYTVSAEEYGSGDDIVIFGDSIASGFGLSDSEYNYGQLIADYISGSVTNYAVSGSSASDTLEVINNLSDEQKAVLKDAEYVIISAGAEDMMTYTSTYILNMCAEINALKEGYTVDDIPEKPNVFDVSDMVDRYAIMDYVENPVNMFNLGSKISALRGHLTLTKNDQNYEKYDRVIETRIMPTLESMVDRIREVNPDAEIVIQTVYNPVQFQKLYYDSTFHPTYRSALNLVLPVFTASSESYRKQLKNISGITTADVLATISSTEYSGIQELSYGWYFTRLQDNENRSIYPSQTGHVAIAATILNAIGKTEENGRLLRDTFQGIENNDIYPAYALAEFKNLVDLNEPFVPPVSTSATSTTATVSTTSTTSANNTTAKSTTTIKNPVPPTTTVSTVTSPQTSNTVSAGSTEQNTSSTKDNSTTLGVTTAAPTSSSTSPVSTKPPVQHGSTLGDVDGNGSVDASDASLTLSEYAASSTGADPVLNDAQKKSADVNGDGKIDATDASTILQFYSYTSTGGSITDMGEWLSK